MFKAKHYEWKWTLDVPLSIVLVLLVGWFSGWTLTYTLAMIIPCMISSYLWMKFFNYLLKKKEAQ